MSNQPETRQQRTERLLIELETWQGREMFAQAQQERIRLELGITATKRHLYVLEGGLSQRSEHS
jgi:hypothetical protein